jgi:uncharacterized membrane protein YfhO
MEETNMLWDLFFAFLLVGMGVFLAFYELRRWIRTKYWPHLLVIPVAIGSELAIALGREYSLVLIVLTLILGEMVARSRK